MEKQHRHTKVPLSGLPGSHIAYHVVFWVISGILWFGLFYYDFQNVATLNTYVGTVLLAQVITAYVTTRLLIPWLLYRHHYVGFGLAYLTMLVLAGQVTGVQLAAIAATGTGRTLYYTDYTKEESSFVYAVLLVLVSNILLAGAKIACDRFQTERVSQQLEKENLELEKERLATELMFLKAQINPHFLFNSLNSIFHLISKDPEQARDLLAIFSDLLRYYLYETTVSRIPLSVELTCIHQYARMEQIRKGEKLTVKIEVGENIGFFDLEPLLLLTFVENAFKHVSHHSNRLNQVTIRVSKDGDSLLVYIENTKEKGRYARPAEGGGIGIANVRRRLELLYPAAHSLHIQEQAELYCVTLELTPNP